MRPFAIRLVCCAVLTALGAPALRAQFNEQIDTSTYWNVRGFNYIFTYSDIHTALNLGSGVTITDVSSPVAQWLGYDPQGTTGQEVAAQLARIKETGANAVRVWLSYYYFTWDSTAMEDKFDAFLTACDNAGLYVMPILWDSRGGDPDTNSLAGADNVNLLGWVRQPSSSEAAGGTLTPQMIDFVTRMVRKGESHTSLLLWNVMNEPTFDYEFTFSQNTLNVIKSASKNSAKTKTSVSPPIWDPWSSTQSSLANDSQLDVLGTHLYGFFRADIEGLCANIRALLGSAYKPILVTEAGNTGYGFSYPDAINLLSHVPASFTGNPDSSQQAGVGFFLFQAYVGNKPNGPLYTIEMTPGDYPFGRNNGLLYNPAYDTGGTKWVRDYTNPTAIATLISLANDRHNASVSSPTGFQYMPTTDTTHYVQPWPAIDGTNRAALDIFFAWSPPDDTYYTLLFGDLIFKIGASSFQWWFWSYVTYPWQGVSGIEYFGYLLSAVGDFVAWRSGNTSIDGHCAVHTAWLVTGYYWSQVSSLYSSGW